MKKFLAIALAVCVLSCCAVDAEARSLVVCYSWSGNTRRVAERLAVLTGSEFHEILTVKPYPEDSYETSAIAIEQRRTGNLPEIAGNMPDVSGYDRIYIGGPVWNSQVSAPLVKYLASNDFSGKTITPFITSQGIGAAGYMRDFAGLLRGNPRITPYIEVKFPGNNKPDTLSDDDIDGILSETNNSVRRKKQ